MLGTNLKHLETREEAEALVEEAENAVICCGRMGPMCLPVYAAMEELEGEYPHVALRDMEFDIPAASFIRDLPECAMFMGLPFTVYFKNGAVVAATTSLQTKEEMAEILAREFGKAAS